jgi:hypothetical protein
MILKELPIIPLDLKMKFCPTYKNLLEQIRLLLKCYKGLKMTKVNFKISSTFTFWYTDGTYICIRCGQTKDLEGSIGKQPLFHWFIGKLYGWRILRKELTINWPITGKKICNWPFAAPMIHDVCGGGRIIPT